MELELEKLNLPADNERPFVIAGPCSAETEEQVMTTAVPVCGNRARSPAASRVTAKRHCLGCNS